MTPDQIGPLVLDVVTSFEPGVVFRLLGNCDAHSRVVQRRVFGKIPDRKRDCPLVEFCRVGDRKVKPLVMTACVGVDAHK